MSFPPCGYDRADGQDGRPGTASPPGSVIQQPSVGIEEQPTSPQVELGEHATFVHTISENYEDGQAILLATPRGTILEDDFGNQYKVLTCSLDYQKGDTCKIITTTEALSVPPEDEYHVETVEFNPSIFLHPRYASVVNYDDVSTSDAPVTGPQIIGWVNAAIDLPQIASQGEWYGQLNSDNITDPDVLSLAQELVTKLRRGEDTFYLSGFRVFWSQYFNLPQGINPGGYTEDPVTQGELPPYFWSSDGTPDGENTLISLAQQVSPLIYPPPTDLLNTISWLRQADTVEYQRVWFKIAHSWIGGPGGTWDNDLYPIAQGGSPSP